MFPRTVCLIASCMLAIPAFAQIYEWRDATGRLHYSDRPPQGVEARLIRGAPGASETAPPPRPTLQEMELDLRERRDREAEERTLTEQQRDHEAELARFCEQGRADLSALESGQRVARLNEQGEREFLNEAERAAQAERIRQVLDERCN